MSSLDIASFLKAAPDTYSSTDLTINRLKYSFAVGLVFFLFFFPCYRSRKSWFDAIAARKIFWLVKLAVCLNLISIAVVLYFYCLNGRKYISPPPPTNLHIDPPTSPPLFCFVIAVMVNQNELTSFHYGNSGDSWLYGYARPTFGIIFVGYGLFSDAHPGPRIICLLGCVAQIIAACLAAYQVNDWHDQIKNNSAPNNGYSDTDLITYYWNEVISVGLATWLLLLLGLLTSILGWCDPQMIHPMHLASKERQLTLDRVSMMHRGRVHRKQIERYVLGMPEEHASLSLRASMPPFPELKPRRKSKPSEMEGEAGDEKKDEEEKEVMEGRDVNMNMPVHYNDDDEGLDDMEAAKDEERRSSTSGTAMPVPVPRLSLGMDKRQNSRAMSRSRENSYRMADGEDEKPSLIPLLDEDDLNYEVGELMKELLSGV